MISLLGSSINEISLPADNELVGEFYSFINIANIVLLLIMLVGAYQVEIKEKGRRIFFRLCLIFAGVMNFFDIFWNLGLRNTLAIPNALMYLLNAFYFISFTASAYFWFAFSEQTYRKTLYKSKAGVVVSLIPCAILLALLIVNVFNGCLFSFDENGEYIIGKYGYLQQIISYSYIIYTAFKHLLTVRYVIGEKDRNAVFTFASFSIPTIICGILQLWFKELPILSSAPVYSLLMVYSSSLHKQLIIDPLTGISNRKSLVFELERRIKHVPIGCKLYFMFMDIDSFKKLNDVRGHVEGDKVLKIVAGELKKIAQAKNGYCTRYGGDEFALIVTIKDSESIDDIKTEIEKNVKDACTFEVGYPVFLSIGATLYEKGTTNARALIIDADDKMYAMKQSKYANSGDGSAYISDVKIDAIKFYEQLYVHHFDGAIILDIKHDKLLEVSRFITKDLINYIDLKNMSYSHTIEQIPKGRVSEIEQDTFIKAISLDTVLEYLKTHESYSFNFQLTEPGIPRPFYKMLYFRYYEENRDFLIVTLEDITEAYQKDIDPLTGILDSTGFYERVGLWVEKHRGKKFSIYRYNLDYFKVINGIYGNAVGDKLLRDLAQYMHMVDNENCFCAHLSADHFVRFCADGELSPLECYNRITDKFKDYGLAVPITLHMGIYDLCEEGNDAFKMSYKALLALQTVKHDMTKPFAYYERGMSNREQRQLELLHDVDSALESGEFIVYMQPQVDYKEKAIFCAEALVRWNHKKHGLIPPNNFIPLLEQSSYISRVDMHVIRTTCSYIRRWMDLTNQENIAVSVNLSRKDILDADFIKDLILAVDEHRISPSQLHLEITESAYIQDAEKISTVVKDLREKGFSIEIDDFGSGYSSLNTLKDLSVDKLKLDMKFLEGANKAKGTTIVSYVIRMAHALKLPIIAEGVETKEQAEMLMENGCKQMQGYYFSKPIPVKDYEKLLLGKTKLDNLK